ncbi:alpha/beta hydrolase-fold protein [Kitasatospora paracochleata]|uniref:S-formylglutathione hydrolase FrmB n=1 Tax=Kitasatospora paracochleata TaxID=58354 RepID=A0ABT1ITN7_9ACTN|nr:alpha/beta hydrolase-fold protein [Kitasatospora paracochleata]MCP2308498.1 S-formylglutathione hydrolase FrmB [Kitasatospora paracochleata]
MGLTSRTLLLFAIEIAVVAVTATIWWWPALARRGWRAVLGRLGMLLGTQFALLAVLGLLANNYFAFYSSWDDLLGTGNNGPVDVRTKAVGATAGPVATPAPSEQPTPEPTHGPPLPVQELGREAVDSGGKGRDPKVVGEIRTVRLAGARSGLSTDGYVYLPPQYFQPQYQDRKFPAVIVMTGFPGDAKNLITRLNYPGAALQLNLSGRMQPTVLVLMRPSPAMPADTECEDVQDGPRSATYFAEDVPGSVALSYRVSADPQGWGIMGNSTGGYCALKLAMRHPEALPSAASISGYLKAAEDVSTGDLFKGSQQRRDEADLMWRLTNRPQPAVSLMLAGAEHGDGDFRKETDAFTAAAHPPMTVAVASVPEGGHNFQTWTKLLPPALEFLSQHLKA